jgi:hypothetical protein
MRRDLLNFAIKKWERVMDNTKSGNIYKVRMLSKSRRTAAVPQYAVFCMGTQATSPMCHAEAVKECAQMNSNISFHSSLNAMQYDKGKAGLFVRVL